MGKPRFAMIDEKLSIISPQYYTSKSYSVLVESTIVADMHRAIS